MTDDELDKARIREALIRYEANKNSGNLFTGFGVILCRLIREDWRPVDERTLQARVVVAQVLMRKGNNEEWVKEFEDGLHDNDTYMQIAKTAIEYGESNAATATP